MVEAAILGLVIALALIRDRASLAKAAIALALVGGAVLWWHGGPFAPGPSGQAAILVLILLAVLALGMALRWWQMRAGPLAPLRWGTGALIVGFGAIGYLVALIAR